MKAPNFKKLYCDLVRAARWIQSDQGPDDSWAMIVMMTNET